MSKLVLVLCVSFALAATACGDDDGPPIGGAGGVGGMAGSGGTGAQDGDAEVPLDAGDAAMAVESGQLTVSLSDIVDMEGKQVIVEVLEAGTGASVAGACAQVDSAAFDVTLSVTGRNSLGLCDYGDNAQLPVGDYLVNVQIQEPEVFPAILCTEASVTVSLNATATVSFDTYRACVGGFPDGVYEGSAFSCASATSPMVHTSIDTVASLMDFREVNISVERNGTQWLETYEDDDCQLELEREIMMDGADNGFLTFSASRTYSWTPSDCTFTATAGGSSEEIGATFDYYQPTTEVRVDDVWFFMPRGAGYRFTGAPGIWTAVTPALELPCDGSEAFARTWTRR